MSSSDLSRAHRKQMTEQVNKQYIESKINLVIEPMASSLFTTGGDQEPIQFMLDYLKNNFGNRPSINQQDKMELEHMRKEVAKLRTEVYGNKNASPNQILSTAGEEQSSEDSEEDFVDDLPMAQLNAKPKARMSVSAEVFGKFHKQELFIPPVHLKSPEQVQAIKSRMEVNFMFSSLNPKDKKAILEAVVGVQKSAGEVIIQEGDDGDNFYLVESGSLSCTKIFNQGDEPTFLKEYQPGESFGELALLYNAPRAATITCSSPTCYLWSLDRNTFNHVIKTAVQIKREKYDDFLEKVEILKCMEKYERTKLADAFKETWFEAGDYIIREGDQNGECFYMIIEGDCIATKVLEPGKPAQLVKEYGPGSYFGERSLLRDTPRAANIIAQSQVCVVSLDRQSFKRLMGPLESILGRNEDEYNKFL